MKNKILFIIFPLSQALMVAGCWIAVGHLNMQGFLCIAFALASDAIVFRIMKSASKKEEVDKKVREMRYLYELEELNNRLVNEKQEELLQMRNMLSEEFRRVEQRLRTKGREGADGEIAKFREMLERTRPDLYTANHVVNAILAEKQKLCQAQYGFSLTVDMQVSAEVALDPMHLCSIFSNIIDNACEAVADFPKEERYIRLFARMKGNYLVIEAKNPARKEHVVRERRGGRGYGTKILNDIAEKYDGELRSEYSGGIYAVSLVVKAL